MITIKNLKKNFGEQTLFTEVTLNIEEREKIGLIGRNGSGKSTFLNMLNHQEEDMDGSIEIPSWLKIKSLEQSLNFSENTLLKQVCSALPKDKPGEEWRAKSVLMGLGFELEDFERRPEEFSSGFQVRIRLAEALVSDAHVLLLDEPTNYLDILSLRWLSRFLKNWSGSFVLITHNQQFMSEVITHTIGIHRQKMRKMKGGPQKLMDQIRMEEEVYEKTRKNQEKKQERTNEFIRTFRAGARSAGLVQSRIKSLAKQKIGKKLAKIPEIKFNFQYEPFRGSLLMEAHELEFGYQPEKKLIHHLSIGIHPKDRIAVIGKNGKGKSTLLKLLTNSLKPTKGKINKSNHLKIGYFASDSKKELNEHHSILEEMITIPEVSEQEVRKVCASLLFTGEAVKKKISQLSGGEKSRVNLGKIILKKSHLLILDEPTNHLDMESCQALNKALKEYKGAVIFVTHDEGMIETVANRLIVFDRDSTLVKNKSYLEFLESEGWSGEDDEFKMPKKVSSTKKDYLDQKDQKKQLRQVRSHQEKTEKEIEKLEKEQIKTSAQLQESCEKKDYESIKKLGEQVKLNKIKIDGLYTELEELMQKEMELEEALNE